MSKNQWKLGYTGVSVTEFGYQGVSVSEQGRGSRYLNQTSVSVSEFFVFLFGYRDPWDKKIAKNSKMAFSQVLSQLERFCAGF